MVYLTDGELVNILKKLEYYHYDVNDDTLGSMSHKLSYISGQLTLLKNLLTGAYKEDETTNE